MPHDTSQRGQPAWRPTPLPPSEAAAVLAIPRHVPGRPFDHPGDPASSLAGSYAAEVLLLRGDPAVAVRNAMLAAARAETIGFQQAAIRALLVQAISLTHLGRTLEALIAAHSGLEKCAETDLTAITSLATVVYAVNTGDRASHLAGAVAAMAAQPGAVPCAAARVLSSKIPPGTDSPADEHVTASNLLEEAMQLCDTID